MLSRGLQPPSPRPDDEITALPMKDTRDWRIDRAQKHHRDAMNSAVAAPPGEITRQQQVDQYLRMLDPGPGGKYPHADYLPGGRTQIAGMSVNTQSMCADTSAENTTLFKEMTTALGYPPHLSSNPFTERRPNPPHRTFRVA
jgi:hypothetical protein